MVPAKWFFNLFPRVMLGSHCSVNRLAHQALHAFAPQFRLPRIYTINQFEGLNGVDGLWLHNRLLPSRSTYNPVTGEGNGLKEFAFQFEALRRAIQLRRRHRIARRMAYVAHIATDICTPPHQHGKLIPLRHKRWYWWWNIRDDWHERYGERYFVDHHMFFEFHALLAVWRQKLPRIVIAPEWQGQSLDQEVIEQAVSYIKENVRLIRSFDLYPQYVREGWTPAIRQQFVEVVFPRIATAVATIWYLAFAGASQSEPYGVRTAP